MSIRVENITKYYGEQIALNKISFSIKQGEIVGFLGPNGAGKSTLIKILTTYISSFEGNAWVNNYSVIDNKIKVQQIVGYLPEHNPLYPELYVKEFLNFNADIYKIDKNQIEKVIIETGLKKEAHKKIRELSKGYKQRIGLASALLHQPKVLILDEPTTGLDPNQLIEIRQLIKKVTKEANITVLFSTHIMQEVEAICDRVIIINNGNLIHDKSISDSLKETNLETLFTELTNQK